MGDGTPITARGAEGRVTGYGDRVVAQGAGTIIHPAAPAPAPAPPAAGATTKAAAKHVAIVMIYDPKPYLTGKLASNVVARVTRDLNALKSKSTPTGLKEDLGITIDVRHAARMSAEKERPTGLFEFPIYILNGHTRDNFVVKDLRQLILAHGIIDRGKSAKRIQAAEAAWRDERSPGLGLQPEPGYRKVAFVKGDLLSDPQIQNNEAAFSNVIKHEFGHMCNLFKHAGEGVMKDEINIRYSDHLNYTQADIDRMVQTLRVFTQHSEEELQKIYEAAP